MNCSMFLGALAIATVSLAAAVQYPAKPVKILFIENKPGAGGNLGTEVAVAVPDKATNEIIGEKAIESRMVEEGADPAAGSPEKFGAFVKGEF